MARLTAGGRLGWQAHGGRHSAGMGCGTQACRAGGPGAREKAGWVATGGGLSRSRSMELGRWEQVGGLSRHSYGPVPVCVPVASWAPWSVVWCNGPQAWEWVAGAR